MKLKYEIIYGHPEAFVDKLRKIWIAEEVKKQSPNQKQCEGYRN